MANGDLLGSVDHIVVLMLENRSFDHMLGFLYSGSGNVSPLTPAALRGAHVEMNQYRAPTERPSRFTP